MLPKKKNQLCHKGHIPVCPQHLSSRLQHLPDDLTEFINNNLQERIAPAMIVRMVKTSYNTTLTEGDLLITVSLVEQWVFLINTWMI